MTNQEFENYLALLSRLLRLKQGQTEQIAGELRDHLELRVSELTESGVEPHEATRIALEEFGDAASLAQQFQFVSTTYQRRWMMRFATLSVAGLFLVAVLVMAMWPENARFGAPDTTVAQETETSRGGGAVAPVAAGNNLSQTTRRNAEIRERLKGNVSMNFEETAFTEVMDFVAAEAEVNLVLSSTARDDSLSEDESITFSAVNLPLANCLRLMLVEHNATYIVKDGVVTVISLDVANDPVFHTRRIHDVSELLATINQLESHRIGEFTVGAPRPGKNLSRGGGGLFRIPQQGGGVGGKGAGALDVADEPGGIPKPVYRVTAEDLLVDTIKETVHADSWYDTNGDGTINVLGGLMIVNQTESANDEIAELLQDIAFNYSQRE